MSAEKGPTPPLVARADSHYDLLGPTGRWFMTDPDAGSATASAAATGPKPFVAIVLSLAVGGRMARLEYLESPMSSRSRRSSRVLPPAPMLDDSTGSEDEDPDSPPHRSSRGRDRDRGRGWARDGDTTARDRLDPRGWELERERRPDEGIIMQTPGSRTSSSSHRPSRRYQPDTRGRDYTPPHSVSSSRASTRVPPMTSMTRPSTAEAPYRRPSLRELAPAGYDDPDARHGARRARSHTRSVHAVPSAPVLRGRVYASGPESNGEDTETTYDSWDSHGQVTTVRVEDVETRPGWMKTTMKWTLGTPFPSTTNLPLPLLHTHARVPIPAPHLLYPSRNQTLRSQKIRKTTTVFVTGLSAEGSPGIEGTVLTKRTLEEDEAKAMWTLHQRPSEKVDRHHPPSASIRRSNTVSGSQAAASQHHSLTVDVRVECIICMDDLPSRKTAKLKCGHRMCHSCLKRSFKLSITDPQHMPPKCCTAATIPLKHVDRLFDNEFKRNWNKKFVEYSTRNRIYCPKKGCSEFIRPEDIRQADDGRKFGKCDKCRTKVCVRCNGRWHSGRDCPKDEDTVRFMAQAKDEGWQCCFRCKAMVELKEGCNHMTCRCGAEFCMICGARWKTCECSWFNYDPAEDDRLDHMQVPLPVRDRFGVRPAVEMPPSPTRQARPGPGMSAFPGRRPRSQLYEGELQRRMLQEDRDEAYARRLQNWQESEDGPEDDFLGGFGDIHGLGNAASHHMNDDFRPRPRHIVAPEPPRPSPLPPMTLDLAPGFDRTAPGDYVLDVNRARGVRAASLGRLADRFNTDLRQGPVHRPPPLPTAATMPLPAMVSAMSPGHVGVPIRRHTVETGDMYDDDRSRPRSSGMRSVERVAVSGRTTRPVFHEEPDDMLTHGVQAVKQHTRDPPKASNLAGLTGSGRGADRVFEWRTHVDPEDDPDAS
ncbi:hypothetical protein LA080_001781 [Diaporthe eres]|nr:hypothetical protein LA080_001781 [Diaporthe eres]